MLFEMRYILLYYAKYVLFALKVKTDSIEYGGLVKYLLNNE